MKVTTKHILQTFIFQQNICCQNGNMHKIAIIPEEINIIVQNERIGCVIKSNINQFLFKTRNSFHNYLK